MPKPWSYPAENVQMWKLERIIPYEKNARTHPDSQIELLAKLMEEYGIDQPIVVDEQGVIIKGHGRRLAAAKAGFPLFPVVVHKDLSEDAKKALRIADNQVSLLAGWDVSLIKSEIGDLRDAGFDLPLLGFDDAALAGYLDVNTPTVDPEQAPEPPKEPVSRLGDLWLLDRHRLLCGDAKKEADVQRVLGDAKPHLMVTDPPYGVNYDPEWRGKKLQDGAKRAEGKVDNDDRADWKEAWMLFPGDVAYVWCASLFLPVVAEDLQAVNFVLRSQIIWDKTRLIIGRGDYHWQHEPCWYAVRKGKKGHWNGDRKQTTVWAIGHQVSETGHGTQKPIECMKRPVENNSKPGDWVYDPFSGSFTTGIACEMTGRKCAALEIDPGYVDVAIERWQKVFGKVAKLESDGKTFEQVKISRKK